MADSKKRIKKPARRSFVLTGQRFGAHMSIAGGFANAFEAGVSAGCDCLQIFVKNQRQWKAAPITNEQIAEYREARERTGLFPVVAHATYLLNLASPDAALRKKSARALVEELNRCETLGVRLLVLHPGSHMGEGLDAGIKRIITSLDSIHRSTRGLASQVLLETTAGQGKSIGHEIKHLGRIIAGVTEHERLAVCLDTCHLFAAGYNLADPAEYSRTVAELKQHVGLDRIRCIHVNDSKGACGSRLDRHQHIGEGRLGRKGFANLVNDPRLAHAPKILETPKGEDDRGRDFDRINLGRLRRLIKKR